LEALPGNSFVVRSFLDIPDDESDGTNLLGDRFLCRGKAVLLAGPTGVGKSSMVTQMAVEFALGRDFFGLKPERPIRTLIVQAENDASDMRDMRSGILQGAKITPAEKEVIGKSLYYTTLNPTVAGWIRSASQWNGMRSI